MLASYSKKYDIICTVYASKYRVVQNAVHISNEGSLPTVRETSQFFKDLSYRLYVLCSASCLSHTPIFCEHSSIIYVIDQSSWRWTTVAIRTFKFVIPPFNISYHEQSYWSLRMLFFCALIVQDCWRRPCFFMYHAENNSRGVVRAKGGRYNEKIWACLLHHTNLFMTVRHVWKKNVSISIKADNFSRMATP